MLATKTAGRSVYVRVRMMKPSREAAGCLWSEGGRYDPLIRTTSVCQMWVT